MKKIEEIKQIVATFPPQSGVYLMKNQHEKIIYVGKAKSLRHRVRSYFSNGKDLSPKTKLLVSNIQFVEYILTKTEVEAFLLEASLIKKHRPKYNIRLRDDKTYPYIKVSMKDAFPRFYLSRKVKRDGDLYFGPFTSGFVVNQTIKILNRLYLIRDCTDHFMKSRTRPCMTHQIGRCTAPCVGLIEEKDYKQSIQDAVLFLRGRDKSLLKELKEKMKKAAEQEQFEVAARLRDGIDSMKAVLEKQIVVNDKTELDQDFIAFVGDERGSLIETLHIRHGRVVGSRPHFIGVLNTFAPEEDPRDWLTSFLNQYYEDNVIPDEVYLSLPLGDDMTKLLEAVLRERKGDKVRVRFAGDSQSQKLIEMAEQNAKEHFKSQLEKSNEKIKGLLEIQRKFHLTKIPHRIECYDISHFQGYETVASQVVFEEGTPSKENYRLYKINTTNYGDDYQAMREVLSRRLKHVEYDDPDLLMVDGGKGQLKMAVEILAEFGRKDIPVVGLAKARSQQMTDERFFLPGRSNPVTFRSNSEAFRILVSLRDEAHRFAIQFHRKRREGTALSSALDTVRGLGDVRKKSLMESFQTVEAIRQASASELASVPGISATLAEEILKQLQDFEESVAESK